MGPTRSGSLCRRADDSAARSHTGYNRATINHQGSVYQEKAHADAGLKRFLKSGLVTEGCRVEDHKVCVGTDLQASLLAGFRRAAFQAKRRHVGHLTYGVHQTEGLALSNILREHAAEGAGVTRVTGQAVAGNYG